MTVTVLIILGAIGWLLVAWVSARLLYKPMPKQKDDLRNLMVAGGLALAWPLVLAVFVVAFLCMGFAWLASAGKAPRTYE